MDKVLYTDNDGLICHYAAAFADFVGCKDPDFDTYHVGQACGIEMADFEGILHDFHLRGLQEFAPLMDASAPPALRQAKNEGWFIHVITARPVEKYPRMVGETHRWYKNFDIPYDAISFDKKKSVVVGRGCIIEDSAINAMEVALAGGKVVLVNRVYNQGTSHPNIRRAGTYAEAVDILKGW